MENHKEERRRAVRIKKTLFVQYKDEAGIEKWDMASMNDFSELGMFIITETPFSIDAVLNFRFKLPSNPFETLILRGRVVACEKRAIAKDRHDAALAGHSTKIEFMDIKEEQKKSIREYVSWFLSKQVSENKEGGAK